MKVTVREIAATAGVSITTVSRVLNGSEKVHPETRDKVLSAINDSGYLRRERKKPPTPRQSVRIVLSDTTGKSAYEHPTVYTILSGLTGRLNELGIGNSLHMLGSTAESVDALVRAPADGFIFIRTQREQEDMVIPKLLSERSGTPILMVNRRIEDKRVSYVNIDDYAAAYSAVEYLIGLGHRNIALINGDETLRNSILRRDGYLSALKAHRLVPGLTLAGKYTEDFGREAALTLAELPKKSRPDAVFTTSDVIALGLVKGLVKAGFALPAEMSIIGFGDVELASYITPSLTTVRIPAREMGVQAANAVNYLISSPSIQNIKISMRSELCVRDSTMRKRKETK